MRTLVYGKEAAILTAVLVGAVFIGAQQNRQEWQLEKTRDPGAYRFTVSRATPDSFWSNANDVPASAFRNFSVGSPDRSGPVRFEYRQDAGSLICQGRMFFGRGSGTWTFQPNPAFIEGLRQLGYSAPGEDQLFDFMQSHVTLDYARAIKESLVGATTAELLDLRHHGIGANFLRDLHAAGYRLDAQDLITLHNHGVSADFAAELKNAGYDLSARSIADLHSNGIGSGYIRNLRSHNLHPPAEDLIRFHSHGVNPDYLDGLEKAGLTNLPPQSVTDLHAHGVGTPFILASTGLGYQFTPRELIDLHAHGVSEDYLRNLRASGMTNLSAEQIVKLRTHGVD